MRPILISSAIGGVGLVAPALESAISNQNFATNTTPDPTLDVSGNFSGSSLVFSINPAVSGVSIDSGTGVITFDISVLGASSNNVTVVATNGAGSANDTFNVSVAQAYATATHWEFQNIACLAAGDVELNEMEVDLMVDGVLTPQTQTWLYNNVTVTASSSNVFPRDPQAIFDRDDPQADPESREWDSNGGNSVSYLRLQFPTAVTVGRVRLEATTDTAADNCPTSFTLRRGSNFTSMTTVNSYSTDGSGVHTSGETRQYDFRTDLEV